MLGVNAPPPWPPRRLISYRPAAILDVMAQQSRYLVTYDIEDDRVRGRVASVLEGSGWRVQKSVFECLLDADGLERLSASLTRELERSPGGDVRVYRLCASCMQASFGLGDVRPGAGSEPWIVV